MKKIIIAAFAASTLFALPLSAAPNPDSNGVNKNCFGQGRSEYASANSGDTSQGTYSSTRAQTPSSSPDYPNQNVQLNKEYKEACQAATPTP